MSVNMAEVMGRVGRGAQRLDNEQWENKDWRKPIRDAIDKHNLDIGNESTCVLGHLFGDFSEGTECLALSEEECWQLGFESRFAVSGAYNGDDDERAKVNAEYSLLNEAWIFLMRYDA